MTTLYVSFRGEYPTAADGGTKPAPIIRPIENIVAFPEGQASSDILQPPSDPSIELRELRGFLFLDGSLYVANGYKDQHQVLRFTPAQQQGQWQYDATVAAASLQHPFDVITGFDGALFVSSQDDNKVTVYGAAEPAGAVFLSGFSALRGLAYDGTYLYVADSGGEGKPGYVGIYDQNAGSHGQLPIAQPVHLLYESTYGWLFIGDEGSGTVWIYHPADGIGPVPLISAQDPPKIDHTAGLALDLSGDPAATLYVASRVAQQVLKFPLDFSTKAPTLSGSGGVALDGLDDEPEFVAVAAGPFS